ncbi:hypothetical protein [Streptacidiphilus cavernicola]|uniref:Uncharacterized protein n=1 Tax=Streptacidiphilus cavernicola TaxID=3342716 RepID=A0ABV6W2H9_9ACTN
MPEAAAEVYGAGHGAGYGGVRFEPFAAQLLLDRDAVTFAGPPYQPPPVLAIWIASLYGYRFSHVDPVPKPRLAMLMHFVRDDDPAARRMAGWMRDPASDPGFVSGVEWVVGGDGFNPPGWRPDVRLVVPPDTLLAVPSMERELERQALTRPRARDGDPGGGGWLDRQPYELRGPRPGPSRQVHPPTAPPDTIARSDSNEHPDTAEHPEGTPQ